MFDATPLTALASSTTIPGTSAEARPLRFPPFHREIMFQGHWEASDQVGRIRIELSGGYADEKHNRFVKVFNVINFSFQPAPLGKLIEDMDFRFPLQRSEVVTSEYQC